MSMWRGMAIVGLAGAGAAGFLMGGTGAAATRGPASSSQVSITSGGTCGQIFCFAPQTLTVAPGTTVTWTNDTTVEHTVTRCDSTNCPVGPGTGTDSAFGSARLGASQTFAVTFHGLGTYNYYCMVHTYAVMHGTITVAAAPLAVTTKHLPGATIAARYRAKLKATGGTIPYHWSIAAGKLPAGLKLSPGGLVSGTPTKAGTSSFRVKVTDSSAPPRSATATLKIGVAAK